MITLINYTSPPFIASGAQEAAIQNNDATLVNARLQGCWKERGFKPGFLLVDFFHLPNHVELFEVLEALTVQPEPL